MNAANSIMVLTCPFEDLGQLTRSKSLEVALNHILELQTHLICVDPVLYYSRKIYFGKCTLESALSCIELANKIAILDIRMSITVPLEVLLELSTAAQRQMSVFSEVYVPLSGEPPLVERLKGALEASRIDSLVFIGSYSDVAQSDLLESPDVSSRKFQIVQNVDAVAKT